MTHPGESDASTTSTQATPAGAGGPARRRMRPLLFTAALLLVLALLFGLPWWELVFSPGWPLGAKIAGHVVFLAALVTFPVLMVAGHGRRQKDAAARIGDTLLGVIWVLFAWSVLGNVLRLFLFLGGVDDPARSEIVAGAVLVTALVLLVWGNVEARRVPRIRQVSVTLPRLGPGLDGTTVVVLTDTHYGPINRVRWSQRVAAAVNQLRPDIVCHTGDIADGSVAKRRAQVAALATIQARLAKVYVTGNHEYFGEAQAWLDHMAGLGWEPLHNRHLTVERGDDHLIVAGIDDATAAGSGRPGHGADPAAALLGADAAAPVLLLAHQPRQIGQAVRFGVDLQVSGHTHGGQIWPFHYLVRVDQPTVSGLSRHGERTQLYTSRGTGFWGPPFRIFAPSEISLLTLRSPAG